MFRNIFAGLGSLRVLFIAALVIATSAGLFAGTVWYQSRLVWKEHLHDAFSAGVVLSEQISAIDPAVLDEDYIIQIPGFSIEAVKPQKVVAADNSVSLRFPDLVAPTFETRFSLLFDQGLSTFEGNRLSLRVFSSDRRYDSGSIEISEGSGLGSRMGALVRALASNCGEPVLFVQTTSEFWFRIEGSEIWGCQSAPPDWRLPALLLSGVIFIVLGSLALNSTDQLERLAKNITSSSKTGQYHPLEPAGPIEARNITAAVNRFFANERERLEQRALLLSGISHDLGTPATRLKLRTALIEDRVLRNKLDADIDNMTEMIEGVLTYARGEISSEQRRQVSMVALVQSVVDDYADTGQPVVLEPVEQMVLKSASSIFSTAGETHQVHLTSKLRLLCQCRPNEVRRALTNLIDNAIKYGKSARLLLEADADEVSISIMDEGGSSSPPDLTSFTAPFERGANAAHRGGVGLGLTIVANIMRTHGGRLLFERVENGIRVKMVLPRE